MLLSCLAILCLEMGSRGAILASLSYHDIFVSVVVML